MLETYSVMSRFLIISNTIKLLRGRKTARAEMIIPRFFAIAPATQPIIDPLKQTRMMFATISGHRPPRVAKKLKLQERRAVIPSRRSLAACRPLHFFEAINGALCGSGGGAAFTRPDPSGAAGADSLPGQCPDDGFHGGAGVGRGRAGGCAGRPAGVGSGYPFTHCAGSDQPWADPCPSCGMRAGILTAGTIWTRSNAWPPGGNDLRIVMLDCVKIKPIFWRPLSHQR